MDTLTKGVAVAELRRLKRRNAEHDQAVREWAAEGFGPQFCVHGTYMWTDHDPICWACEEWCTVYEEAIRRAHSIVREHERRVDGMRDVLVATVDMPDKVRIGVLEVLQDWACEELRQNQ